MRSVMDFDYADFSTAFPWFFPSAAFIFGAIVGSFLNVCIYRIPAGKSVVTPRSQCGCGKPIAWFDNIPVLSWFILRGRARCCGRAYSFRYAFVELLTGGLFALCWLLFPPAKALCALVLVSALICATFIDLDHFEIPNVFTIGLAMTGLVFSFAVPALHSQSNELFVIASLRSGAIGLKGFLIGTGLLLWVAILAEEILKKQAMGFGDVKFIGAIGAFCGWQGAIASIFGGALIGTLWFVLALGWQKISGKKMLMKPLEPGDTPSNLGLSAHVPYGPMLALGALAYFFYLHHWVDAYFAEIGTLLG